MALTNEARLRTLLAQHRHLCLTIMDAQRAARDFVAGRGDAESLRRGIDRLGAELHAHLAEEERLLEPVIATIDAWGPVRLELLRAEHAHQRAVLAVFNGTAAWRAPALVADRVLALCDEVLADMEAEEREILNDRVLRDDLVLLDASDC
jgi:hypothetical protein